MVNNLGRLCDLCPSHCEFAKIARNDSSSYGICEQAFNFLVNITKILCTVLMKIYN